MNLLFTPLDSTLGARVTGGRIADFTETEWTQVIDGFHTYAALVFPDQHLTPEEHVAFGKRFGEIECLRPGQPYVAVSNLTPDGKIMTPKEKRYQTLRGNEGWHTDSTYMPISAKASALAAEVVPAEGGETEFLYQSERTKPEEGKIVLAPADFMHTHRGNPPISNDKYIITGFFNISTHGEDIDMLLV